MNRKTKYLIPAFAAVFAMMFAFASPLAMAEPGDDTSSKWSGQKHHKMHKVVEVENFVGTIQITEGSDRQALKDQVTVSLSEASEGLDVMGGHIGMAINEDGDKFVVWALKSVEKDLESETATVTIHVVDAGDIGNVQTTVKEVDLSEREGKFTHYYGDKRAKIAEKIERLSQPTGDADTDAARAAFVEKLQELRTALENGNPERASELRDELKDLRDELGSTKSYQR